MDKICVGMQVNIERSDGRVHGALVTSINKDTKMTSVEWFEKNETKGKDVDIVLLIRNNPAIFNIKTGPTNDGEELQFGTGKLIGNTSKKQESSKSQEGRRLTNVLNTNRATNLFCFNDVLLEESLEDSPNIGVRTATQPSSVVPKVVSAIDEMEKNRQQRRARNNLLRKEREEKMSIDPGNPNWEFLSMIRDYQSQLEYRPMRLADPVSDNRICVCVRKRPMNSKEINRKEIEVITVPIRDTVIVHQPQQKVDLTKYLENQRFRFDYAFDENATNELVYRFTAQPLVRNIFQHGFSTCFAYGQTGSGKTHTMGGVFDGKSQDWANGIYGLTAIDVFNLNKDPEFRKESLSISCSFFEIYGAKVFDLLGKRAKLRVLEDGRKLVQVVGLKEIKANCVEDVVKLIKQGSEQRTAGQTSANNNSSRSHAVFQIILRKKEGANDQLYGKFSLIDLAGNERGADTISSDRQTRLEGAEINKSLLALKECIRAMGRDEQHVPFRGSKLTLILRDSFIGKNAKTCMIAMISPGMSCVENTMNTLRYADRVKELGNDDEQIQMEVDDDTNSKLTNGTTAQSNPPLYGDSARQIAYQEAVEALDQAEETAIDQHRGLLRSIHSIVKSLESLLTKTDRAGYYDMEAYVREFIKKGSELQDRTAGAIGSFENFMVKIREEQELSISK